jgi:ribose 5-phosphate isomerase A
VPVPVEIVPFGWQTTAERLTALGAKPVLRQAGAEPFRTDGGNLILDCHFGPIADPGGLEARLSATIGVVETGLFIGMASTALVAMPDGVRRLDRPSVL